MGFVVWVSCLLAGMGLSASDGMVLWSSGFEALEAGAEPEGVLILRGEFAGARVDGEGVLRLAGAPLETMGIVFGPSRSVGVEMVARVRGESRGRQRPAMGIGLCGPRGFRLMVTPMRGGVQLEHGDRVLDRRALGWESRRWYWLKLRVMNDGDRWRVRGRVWGEGEDEPGEWMITHTTNEPPPNGGASLWGVPYSGKPIDYDDVSYRELEP